MYYKPKIWTSKTEELQQESQRKLKGIHVTVCALYDVSYNLPNLLEMLETRRKELEEELVRVEEKANARLERVRERGSQVVPANEQDAELEELEAEIEMYALALGEEKEEDMELNPEEASQGPLTFPKHDPDETMDSAWPFKNKVTSQNYLTRRDTVERLWINNRVDFSILFLFFLRSMFFYSNVVSVSNWIQWSVVNWLSCLPLNKSRFIQAGNGGCTSSITKLFCWEKYTRRPNISSFISDASEIERQEEKKKTVIKSGIFQLVKPLITFLTARWKL